LFLIYTQVGNHQLKFADCALEPAGVWVIADILVICYPEAENSNFLIINMAFFTNGVGIIYEFALVNQVQVDPK
jgi:hypothetical protein